MLFGVTGGSGVPKAGYGAALAADLSRNLVTTMPSHSPSTAVQPPRASISWDTEAPTHRLPVVAPTPPSPTGKARRTVRRVLVGLLLLFFGLILLGALLPSTDATPPATDAGPPSITDTVPSVVAPPPPAESIPDAQPPVLGPEPAPVVPRTAAPEPVARQPVARQPVPTQLTATPQVPTPRTAAPPADPRPAAESDRSSTSYANCAEVRAAGAAPIRRGDPGYSSKLDRDGDGVACET